MADILTSFINRKLYDCVQSYLEEREGVLSLLSARGNQIKKRTQEVFYGGVQDKPM